MNPTDRSSFERFAARVLRTGVLGVKKITGIFRKPSFTVPENPQRVLVVKLWGLGSTICASPAMRALRERYPEAEFTLLTHKNLETLYEGIKIFDRILSWDAQGVKTLPGAVRRFREQARDYIFDMTINLDGLSNMACLLTHMSGAEATVGFVPSETKRRGYTKPVVLDENTHAIDSFLQIAAAAGANPDNREIVPPPLRSTDRINARNTLEQWGLDEHTMLVGFNINTTEFAQRRAWPAEKFVLLAQGIEELGSYKTIFFGTAQEERYVSRFVKQMDTQPVNLSGRTSLRQLAALIGECHLFIGNDSGPLHLAAALGIPTVGIFGPETPTRFSPPESEKSANIYHEIDCSPCVSFMTGRKKPCERGFECVREITIDEVRSVVGDMLDHLTDPETPPWG